MTEKDWAHCREAFHWDGSLRDIYILGTVEGDWESFLSFVKSRGFALRYERDGKHWELPNRAAAALADRSCAHNLIVTVASVTFHCHFFTPDEIELDLDPREVTSQGSLETVLSFMSDFGSHLSKDVILTEESSPEHIWFRYSSSDGRLRYVWNG